MRPLLISSSRVRLRRLIRAARAAGFSELYHGNATATVNSYDNLNRLAARGAEQVRRQHRLRHRHFI
jgi:hypothetical protein